MSLSSGGREPTAVEKPTFATTVNAPKYLFASFFLFGLAQLLPWNIYIKSIPYFRSRLIGSHYVNSVASFIPSGFTLANMATMLVIALLRWDEYFMHARGRIFLGMIANALIMGAMAIVTIAKCSQTAIFIIVTIFSSLAGISSAFMIKGLLGMASRFPAGMTPWLLAGQAAAGLLVSVATLASTLTIIGEESNEGKGSLGPILYFSLGTLTMLFSVLVLFVICLWSPFFRHYMGLDAEQESKAPNSSNTARHHPQGTTNVSFSFVWTVFKQIRWFAIGICVTLAVTISIYATFITAPRIRATSLNATFSSLYVPLIFIIYDVGDMLGRWLPAIDALNPSYKSKKLRSLPWARLILFLPVFLVFAPVNVTGHEAHRPLVDLPDGLTDVVYVLSIFSFAISNGYCCTVLLMHAPAQAISHHYRSESGVQHDGSTFTAERESCGALMGLALNIGLVIGSLSSFFWRAILK